MPRPRKFVTVLVKKRLNMQLTTRDLAAELDLADITIQRIERGVAVSRNSASKYLSFFGIDMNNEETIPIELKILDGGVNVRIMNSN